MVISLARKFLTAAARGSLDEYFSYGKLEHLFKNVEVEQFEQFDKHVKKHAALPSDELLGQWWDSVPPAPDAPSFYLDLLRNRHMEHFLKQTITDANKLVGDDHSEDAAKLIVERVMPELLSKHGTRIVHAGEAYELAMQNYLKQMKMGDEYGVRLGYPVVDDYGGLVGGDVLSLVGRPAAGKSFLSLRGARHAWRQKKNAAFWSMEMNNLISAQRLVAMDAEIPLNALKLQKGQGLSTPQMEKLKKSMTLAKQAPSDLILMDGNLSTTVEGIWNFCRHIRPDVVFIDGAYMLKHPNPRLGRFERVAENCELLKQEIAGNLGIPVVASWQFSREAAKKMGAGKKGGTVGLEDIGYSDAIGQISSIVLGLLEEDNVETLNRKKVTIMKGRSGEVGSFDIHWQFNPVMCFDMYEEPEVGELEFL